MEKTWKPTTAGILNIISGVFGIALGISMIIISLGLSQFLRIGIDIEMIVRAFDVNVQIVTIAGIIIIVFGIIALSSGYYAIKRRKWGLALVGSILALFIGNILGLLALIFVSLGKNEFSRQEEGEPNEEPTLGEVMKELRRWRRSYWFAPAAFGGSMVFLGASLRVEAEWLPILGYVFMAVGIGFMIWCFYMQYRIKI